MTLDYLWTPTNGANWYDRTTPEIQQFCKDLAALVAEKGQEPVWTKVAEHMAVAFPDANLPKSKHTVQQAVRRLVKEAI
jgi:hypothetical protein